MNQYEDCEEFCDEMYELLEKYKGKLTGEQLTVLLFDNAVAIGLLVGNPQDAGEAFLRKSFEYSLIYAKEKIKEAT